jgi:hypothetical protein
MNGETPASRDNAGEAETAHGNVTNDGELKGKKLVSSSHCHNSALDAEQAENPP